MVRFQNFVALSYSIEAFVHFLVQYDPFPR